MSVTPKHVPGLKTIIVLIPCRNEAKSLPKVLKAIPHDRLRVLGYRAVVTVIDNDSTDDTAAVATKHGANVVREPRHGKGYALNRGFSIIPKSASIVVMFDGDGTYHPEELPRLIEPIDSRFCHAVVGSRLGGKIRRHALHPTNRLFNWLIAFLVRSLYLANITDVLSGYFAWKREVVDLLAPHLRSPGFAIEAEMITKMEKLGFDVYSVPITYERRQHGQSKISRMRDGVAIIRMLIANMFWLPTKELRHKVKFTLLTL